MNTFKIILIIVPMLSLINSVVSLPVENIQNLIEHSQVCRKESDVPVWIATRVILGEFPNDEKLKSHIFCMSKKLGFQDEAGEINKEVLVAKLGRLTNDLDKTRKVVDDCAFPRDTPEETAFESIKCYFTTTGTNLLF